MPSLSTDYSLNFAVFLNKFPKFSIIILTLNNPSWLAKPYWIEISTQFDILSCQTIVIDINSSHARNWYRNSWYQNQNCSWTKTLRVKWSVYNWNHSICYISNIIYNNSIHKARASFNLEIIAWLCWILHECYIYTSMVVTLNVAGDYIHKIQVFGNQTF